MFVKSALFHKYTHSVFFMAERAGSQPLLTHGPMYLGPWLISTPHSISAGVPLHSITTLACVFHQTSYCWGFTLFVLRITATLPSPSTTFHARALSKLLSSQTRRLAHIPLSFASWTSPPRFRVCRSGHHGSTLPSGLPAVNETSDARR